MNKRSIAPEGMTLGISTVAVIFVILGLTIFAVLSLSTASREKKLSEKYADSVTRYWAADEACTQTALDFRALWAEGGSAADLARLAAQTGAGLSREGENTVISYTRTISDYSHLSVRLSLGEDFNILEWKTVADGDWQPDDTLNLWQGGK